MAPWSKALFCGRSIVGIVGSNLGGLKQGVVADADPCNCGACTQGQDGICVISSQHQIGGGPQTKAAVAEGMEVVPNTNRGV